MTEHTEVILFLLIAGLLFAGLSISAGINNVSVSEVTCTDSDNLNIVTTGKVVTSTGSYMDVCTSSSDVIEYYCDGTNMRNVSVGCLSGYSCNGGRCIPSTPPCTLMYNGVMLRDGSTYYNSCVSMNRRLIYTCDGANYKIKELDCGEGFVCSDGGCIVDTST
ncbi:MAG: hypothetical protein ABID61_01085 [Candidatus Micrarchaeota archaeon]